MSPHRNNQRSRLLRKQWRPGRTHALGPNDAVNGSDILVATGRTPNTAGVYLEAVGIKLDERGYIQVNERLGRSSQCLGHRRMRWGPQDDFRIIRDNLAGGNRTTCNRIVPCCWCTDPQVAHVGLTETEATRRRIAFRVSKCLWARCCTQTVGETRGYLKAADRPERRSHPCFYHDRA